MQPEEPGAADKMLRRRCKRADTFARDGQTCGIVVWVYRLPSLNNYTPLTTFTITV